MPEELQDRETQKILHKTKECDENDLSKKNMNQHSTHVS